MQACAYCGASLADDQRYCLECGGRQVQARSQFLDRFTPAALGPDERTVPAVSGRSSSATAVAGVGVLLLAMGVGVLIGRASGGKTVTEPAQVISVASPAAAPGSSTATTPALTTSTGSPPSAAGTHTSGGSSSTSANGKASSSSSSSSGQSSKSGSGASKTKSSSPQQRVQQRAELRAEIARPSQRGDHRLMGIFDALLSRPDADADQRAPAGDSRSSLPSPSTDGRASLERRRDELVAQVAELHWDLGGLAYEMAIRDHFRLDVLVRRAAELQERDAELGELERVLSLSESAGVSHARTAGRCTRAGRSFAGSAAGY